MLRRRVVSAWSASTVVGASGGLIERRVMSEVEAFIAHHFQKEENWFANGGGSQNRAEQGRNALKNGGKQKMRCKCRLSSVQILPWAKVQASYSRQSSGIG